jgi:hypothetical protein
MRYGNFLVAVAVAGLATAAVATSALAQAGAAPPSVNAGPVTDPDAILQLNNAKLAGGGIEQRGCVASDKVYGDDTVAIDGYKYGGCLARGADKNLAAMRVLIEAAQATGQFRNNAYGFATQLAYYLVLGDTTTMMRIEGSGTWQGQKVDVRMDWDYRVPGVRFYITHADKSQDITVAADPRNNPAGRTGHREQPELFGNGAKNGVMLASWKEKPAGVYAGAADMSPQELLVLAYLMPSNVILEGRDAADKMKLSKDASNRDVLTIPIPELGGANMVATLNADSQPVHTEIKLNGKTYSADFDNYLSDRADFEVYFPHQISIQVDGKPLADWQLDFHHVNPYLIFPVPTQVAAKQ